MVRYAVRSKHVGQTKRARYQEVRNGGRYTMGGGVVRLRRSNKNGYLENPTRKSKEKHESTENEVGEMSGIVERAR